MAATAPFGVNRRNHSQASCRHELRQAGTVSVWLVVQLARITAAISRRPKGATLVRAPMIGNFGPMRIRKSGRPGDEAPTSQDKST